MEYTFTDEDVKLVEKLINIKNKGYYCNGAELTAVYNRVLHKNAPQTNCSSCMRQRISELENALNHFKKQIENKAISSHTESKTQVEGTTIKEAPKKAVGRPRKTQ